MSEQLQLHWGGKSYLDEHEDRALDLLRELVEALGGLKECAYLLDVPASQLNHALRRRDRHAVKHEWVTILLEAAGRQAQASVVARRYLAHRAGLVRCEVLPARELSDAERVRALEDALRASLGPELVAGLLRKAYGAHYETELRRRAGHDDEDPNRRR